MIRALRSLGGTKAVRRGAAAAAVLATVALVSRIAAAAPFGTATLAAAGAVGALITGIVVNGRRRNAQWRTAWALLGAGLAVSALTTTATALVHAHHDLPTVLRVGEVLGAALAAAGIMHLLRNRVESRAGDILLEGAIIAAACTYVAWAWTVAQHMEHVVPALVPVFAWVLVVWLAGRLLFLTSEQITGYRMLTASFVALLLSAALEVGAESGVGSAPGRRVSGIALCAYVVWGLAAAHRSTRGNFAPTELAPARFGPAKLAGHLAIALVAPVALLLLPTTRQSPGLTALVACSALVPLLLVGYLVRQVRGRARAEYRAQHDELTGLANRRLFQDRAEAAFREARRDGTRAAVLFLDLDRFKSINDSLGHTIGNHLLQGVAKRLTTVVRDVDTVARFGGDEFTILVSGVDGSDEVAELARGILDLFARPFPVGGRELHSRSSIGIAMFPEDGEDIDTLLKNADVAMYRAKARGRDAFEFYTPSLAIRAQTKLSVESGLRQALERGTLELYYQPQLDVGTGRIFGLEALARWRHPKLGMIPPDVFVPVAEESSLVVALGEWVLDTACAQARAWLDAGLSPRPIAVNISARHFATDGFADAVRARVEKHALPPGTLEIEITESIFMRDLDQASIELAALRGMGVRCAIDDFGTGFSGLRYLADMSIDSLKIDQSFVSLLRGGESSPIIDAIIGLGQRLELDVVAEGVETQAQAAFLLSQGCTRMQGYLFARPLPAAEIAAVLRADDCEREARFDAIVAGLVVPAAELAPATNPNDDARLLRMICGSPDVPLDVDAARLTALLEALANDGVDAERAGAFLRIPARVAAGTCVGLVPLVGGLAAAGALPNAVQNVVAASGRTVGIEIPRAVTPARRLPVVHVVRAASTPPAPATGHSGVASAGRGATVGATVPVPSLPVPTIPVTTTETTAPVGGAAPPKAAPATGTTVRPDPARKTRGKSGDAQEAPSLGRSRGDRRGSAAWGSGRGSSPWKTHGARGTQPEPKTKRGSNTGRRRMPGYHH